MEKGTTTFMEHGNRNRDINLREREREGIDP